jgi:hypothetical protein
MEKPGKYMLVSFAARLHHQISAMLLNIRGFLVRVKETYRCRVLPEQIQQKFLTQLHILKYLRSEIRYLPKPRTILYLLNLNLIVCLQMGRERAWPSPQNDLTSGFRDVSPSQRPGPLLSSVDQRSRLGNREWSAASPSRKSPPRHNTGSPSAIDSYGVLRDPRRISPQKVNPPKQQTTQGTFGTFGTELNYRRTQSAQDPRRSWSGNVRHSYQENRFSTPQYVRSTPMRGFVSYLCQLAFPLAANRLCSIKFSACRSNCLHGHSRRIPDDRRIR